MRQKRCWVEGDTGRWDVGVSSLAQEGFEVLNGAAREFRGLEQEALADEHAGEGHCGVQRVPWRGFGWRG